MLGQMVSHYRVLGLLGQGGMGNVYLAEDTKLHRRVALKFMTADPVRSPESSARLVREAQAASALDHPNIATIYEIGDHDGQPFIAMAYYDGETLATRLARGPLSMVEAARIVMQVADALAAAHAAGIVHRDLKPSNLMLTATHQVKVLDFGIATFASSEVETMVRLTGAGTTVGTAAYMSPEQAVGEPVDTRTDLWSLGVVTREMLTGRQSFEGSNPLAVIHAITTTSPPPLRSERPDVAPELEEIVSRLMVRDRHERTITAADVHALAAACVTRLSTGGVPIADRPRTHWRLGVGLAAVVIVTIVVALGWVAHRNARVKWAREQALPEIGRLGGERQFYDAYQLAERAGEYIGDDPALAEQLRLVSRPATIDTEPPGAEVSYARYGSPDGRWTSLGHAPIRNMAVPRGILRWRVSLDGYEVAEDVGPGPFWPPTFQFRLVRLGDGPPDMVRLSSRGEPFELHIPGLDHLPAVDLPDYWIDRHEVTNRDYKRFVDAGGYRRRDLWPDTFVKDGRSLNLDAAMALLVDSTGMPGPAGWEQGGYAAGQELYPVTGVSWYEASAYARWAGKSLPTIYHWSRAADQRLSGDVVPAGNFGGKGLMRVGELLDRTRGGTIGMAGNAKEWCSNASQGRRLILGGAWNEPVYMFTDADAQAPLTRGATFGFRCMKLDRSDGRSAALAGPVEVPSRNFRDVRPVSDDVFHAWQSLYTFDHGNLEARVESVDDESPEWRVEHVSYSAAYNDERIPALLFVPKHVRPPFQTLVIFPGSNTISQRTLPSDAQVAFMSFVMRSGRALLYPIYKSTHQRGDVIANDYPNKSAVWRDHMVMWSKDLGRSIDYLHSRPDIDHNRIGYLGFSWGGGMAPLFLALEPRLSLAVLLVGGFYLQEALPEADPVNFAPRVTMPVLMLNGRFDFFFPTDTSQEPMFELLGTPADRKRRVVYDSSHTLPRGELIKEFEAWTTRFWGPVAR